MFVDDIFVPEHTCMCISKSACVRGLFIRRYSNARVDMYIE